jgi:hypothetical protein
MLHKNSSYSLATAISLSVMSLGIQAFKKKDVEASQWRTQSITPGDPISDAMKNRYGMLPYKNSGFYKFEWEEYAKCMPKEAKEIFANTAENMQLRNPSVKMNKYDLFTVIMGEGFGWQFDEHPNDIMTAEVDGYVVLGVDFFVDELQNMKNEGLLPSDFSEGKAFSVREAI